MRHGTHYCYAKGCRCEVCVMGNRVRCREYQASRFRTPKDGSEAWERLRDALMWIAPDGLTDDCPARRKMAA